MKKVVKKHYKVIIGIILGLIVSTMGTYAAEQVLTSDEVLYTNSTSGEKTVQAAIDDLYKKTKELTGEGDKKYTESILHGADPVLGTGMIPVTIDAKGTVKYASENAPWYSYEEKRWANAVILSNSKNYKVGDVIEENDISAYFVWIPRYSYKIWDLGQYDNYYKLNQLTDTANGDISLKHIAGNARLIDIQFGATKNDSGTTVGSYYTNEAFTTFGTKGLWVGKFEITGSISSITVKPGQVSVRGQTVGQFWKALYKYNRDLDSHMMKNTEWGAVAYLSHSIYGKGSEVNINNNSSFLTGYSATAITDQSSYPGEGSTDATKTQPYNTATGYQASTTGNITGIYDMSGGAWEYMASYWDGHVAEKSGLTNEELTQYSKYFDKYSSSSDNLMSFSERKLGDATGEMGPFYTYNGGYVQNSWYTEYAYYLTTLGSWFTRGGQFNDSYLAGQFSFNRNEGFGGGFTERLVLAPTES